MVVGHYGCGGVSAAMNNKPHGLIDNLLNNIKDVMQLHELEFCALNISDYFYLFNLPSSRG